MKSYYRNAKSVIQLSLILLQVLSEKYTGKNAAPIRPIDSEFGLRGEELDLLRRGVFDRHPEAMLRAFYLRATWPGIRAKARRSFGRSGIHSETLTSISRRQTKAGRSFSIS